MQESSFITIIFKLFTSLLLAMLHLHCCVGSSLVAPSRGYSPVAEHRLLIVVASLAVDGFPGPTAQARYLLHAGLAALQHVGSSWTRD